MPRLKFHIFYETKFIFAKVKNKRVLFRYLHIQKFLFKTNKSKICPFIAFGSLMMQILNPQNVRQSEIQHKD